MITAVLIGLLVVAGLGLKILIVKFIADRLTSRNWNRTKTGGLWRPRSRFFRDLQPREDLLVEHLAHSKELANVLGVLASHDKPVSFATIVHEIRIGQNRPFNSDIVPARLVGPALLILHAAGLVRLKRGGFLATGIGRAVQRRIAARPLSILLYPHLSRRTRVLRRPAASNRLLHKQATIQQPRGRMQDAMTNRWSSSPNRPRMLSLAVPTRV